MMLDPEGSGGLLPTPPVDPALGATVMEPDASATSAATQANTDTVELDLNAPKKKAKGGVI